MWNIWAVVHFCQNIIALFQHPCNSFSHPPLSVSLLLCHTHFPSLSFISILPLTKPPTSYSVSISWCPPDAPHSLCVEVVSSLRYSVLGCACSLMWLCLNVLFFCPTLNRAYLHAVWFAFMLCHVHVFLWVYECSAHSGCQSVASYSGELRQLLMLFMFHCRGPYGSIV